MNRVGFEPTRLSSADLKSAPLTTPASVLFSLVSLNDIKNLYWLIAVKKLWDILMKNAWEGLKIFPKISQEPDLNRRQKELQSSALPTELSRVLLLYERSQGYSHSPFKVLHIGELNPGFHGDSVVY